MLRLVLLSLALVCGLADFPRAGKCDDLVTHFRLSRLDTSPSEGGERVHVSFTSHGVRLTAELSLFRDLFSEDGVVGVTGLDDGRGLLERVERSHNYNHYRGSIDGDGGGAISLTVVSETHVIGSYTRNGAFHKISLAHDQMIDSKFDHFRGYEEEEAPAMGRLLRSLLNTNYMPQTYWPVLYKGPYGRMSGTYNKAVYSCPVNLQVMDISLAANVGYGKALTSWIKKGSTTFEDMSAAVVDPNLVQNNIIDIVNHVNVLYSDQLNVFLRIRNIEIRTSTTNEKWNLQRTSSAANPKGCTHPVPATPLGTEDVEINSHLNNFGEWKVSLPEEKQAAGLWHLLTDCFPAPGVVGLAWPGTICWTDKSNVGWSSFYVMDSSLEGKKVDRTFMTVAHEIGHNFGAQHTCTGSGCPILGDLMSYAKEPEYNFQKVVTVDNPGGMCYTVMQSYKSTTGYPSCLSDFALDCKAGGYDQYKFCDGGPSVSPTTAPSGARSFVVDLRTVWNYRIYTYLKIIYSSSGITQFSVLLKRMTDPSFSYEVVVNQMVVLDSKNRYGFLFNNFEVPAALDYYFAVYSMPDNKLVSESVAFKLIDPLQVTAAFPSLMYLEDTVSVGWLIPDLLAPKTKSIRIEVFQDTTLMETITSESLAVSPVAYTFASTLTAGKGYYFKVSMEYFNGFSDIYYGSSNVFELKQKNAIVVVNPGVNAVWLSGFSYDISWSVIGQSATSIQISLVGETSTTVVKSITAYLVSNRYYSWVVSKDIATGKKYRIRLAEVRTDGVTPLVGFSGVFAIESPPVGISISIASPVSTSSWRVGSTGTVEWSTVGAVGTVNVILSSYSLGISDTIASKIVNTGSFTYSIPSSMQSASDYKISVQSSITPTLIVSSPLFALLRNEIIVTVPSSTTPLIKSDKNPKTISWKCNGDITALTMTLLKGDTAASAVKVQDIASAITPSLLSYTNWNLPAGVTGTNFYISLVDANGVTGYSSQFTIAPVPSLKLSAPKKDDQWVIGDRFAIQWKTVGYIGRVILQLNYLNGKQVTYIESSVENTGSYEWYIPTTLTESTSYQVKITSLDHRMISDYTVFDQSDFFSLSKGEFISFQTPSSSAVVQTGVPYKITWLYYLRPTSAATFTINLHGAGSDTKIATLSSAVSVSASTYTYTFDKSLPDGVYYVVAMVNGWTYATSGDFNLYTKAVFSFLPLSPSMKKGEIVPVQWTVTNGGGNISQEKVDLKLVSATGSKKVIAPNIENSGKYVWVVPKASSAPPLVGAGYSIEISYTSKLRVTSVATSAAFAVTAPDPQAGGELLTVLPLPRGEYSKGSSIPLSWTSGSSGTVYDYVSIVLHQTTNVFSDVIIATVTEGTDNVNSFLYATPFNPSVEPRTGTTYYFEITVYSNHSSVITSTSGKSKTFSLVAAASTLSLVHINEGKGDAMIKGETSQISLIATGNIGRVNVDLYSGNVFIMKCFSSREISSTGALEVLPWDVPLTNPPSEELIYRLKVEAVTASISFFSNEFPITYKQVDGSQNVAPIIKSVYSPASKAKWIIGDYFKIKWDYAGDVSLVDIELWLRGTFLMTVASNVFNANEYEWIIPYDGGVTQGNGYTFRVVGSIGQASGKSGVFSIVNPEYSATSYVNLLTDTTGALFVEDLDRVELRWVSSNKVEGGVNVDLVDSQSNLVIISILANGPSSGSFAWKVPKGIVTNLHTRTVAIKLSGTNAQEAVSNDFTVAVAPKVLNVVASPSKSYDAVYKGNMLAVTWEYQGPEFEVIMELYRGAVKIDDFRPSSTESVKLKKFTTRLYLESTSLPIPGEDYKVYVSSKSDTSVFAFSNSFTIKAIRGTLTFGVVFTNAVDTTDKSLVETFRQKLAASMNTDSTVVTDVAFRAQSEKDYEAKDEEGTMSVVFGGESYCTTSDLRRSSNAFIVTVTLDATNVAPENLKEFSTFNAADIVGVWSMGVRDGSYAGLTNADWTINKCAVASFTQINEKDIISDDTSSSVVDGSGGLSGGAIGGIVAGVIFICLAILIVAYRTKANAAKGPLASSGGIDLQVMTSNPKWVENPVVAARANNITATAAPIARSDVAKKNRGLPPGWEENRDDDGNVYYYNVNTQESQWDKPSYV